MTTLLPNLSADELRDIATAMRRGNLSGEISATTLRQFISPSSSQEAALALESLTREGMTFSHVALLLEFIATERARPHVHDLIDLVTTGPEAADISNRDTAVVVRELFAQANQSVLVAGYAVHQGRRVFEALARRMCDRPHLNVRLFLDVQRAGGDPSNSDDIVRRYGQRFVTAEWPRAHPLPNVYYFPRSLVLQPGHRASLHAKCVVVDGTRVFVSSANFTGAAQEKNIEVGLLVQSPVLAERITRHFDALLSDREFLPLDLTHAT